MLTTSSGSVLSYNFVDAKLGEPKFVSDDLLQAALKELEDHWGDFILHDARDLMKAVARVELWTGRYNLYEEEAIRRGLL